MAFDIHQQVFDKNGMLREKVARQYQDQLVQLFVQSPESQAVPSEDYPPGTGPRIPLPGERSENARKVHSQIRRTLTRDSRNRKRRKK